MSLNCRFIGTLMPVLLLRLLVLLLVLLRAEEGDDGGTYVCIAPETAALYLADENAEDEDFEEEDVAAPDNCFFLVGGMTSRMRTPSAKVSMRAGAVALVAVKGASMPLSSAVDASCEASCLRFFSLSRPLISERWPPICADSRARDFSNTNHSSNCPTESRPPNLGR